MVRIVRDFMITCRLKASSLIEVVTALIIISMVFSMAIVIYLNVQRSGFSSRKLIYTMMLDEVYSSIPNSVVPGSLEFNYEDVFIHQEISVHSSNTSLFTIHLEARNEDGKLLVEKKFLRYAPSQQ